MTSLKGSKWGGFKKQYPQMDMDRNTKPLKTRAMKKHNQLLRLSGHLAIGDIQVFDNEWDRLHPSDPIKKPNRFMRLIGRAI